MKKLEQGWQAQGLHDYHIEVAGAVERIVGGSVVGVDPAAVTLAVQALLGGGALALKR